MRNDAHVDIIWLHWIVIPSMACIRRNFATANTIQNKMKLSSTQEFSEIIMYLLKRSTTL